MYVVFYYFINIKPQNFDINTLKMTFAITILFIVRSSCIIGYLPLALIKNVRGPKIHQLVSDCRLFGHNTPIFGHDMPRLIFLRLLDHSSVEFCLRQYFRGHFQPFWGNGVALLFQVAGQRIL